MSWKEIDEEVKLAGVFMDFITSQIALNADLKLRSLENQRNYAKDPYYDNYDRFTPAGPSRYIETISEFKNSSFFAHYSSKNGR